MGNVIAFKKGTGGGARHLLFSAHMDEIGFIIMDATDDGLLLFCLVGGIDPRVAVSKYVVVGEKAVKGVIGALAIHLQSPEDRKRVLGWNDLYIDIGAKTKEEALADCPVGAYAYYDSAYQEFGAGAVVAKALDDRVGCYNLLRLLEGTYAADITCAFVVQEEVGLRGATGRGLCCGGGYRGGAGGHHRRGYGRCARRAPGVRAGPRRGGFLYGRRVHRRRRHVSGVAFPGPGKGISAQVKRGATGGNDGGAYQRSREGKRVCVLSVPCRYIHGPSSVVMLSDVEVQIRPGQGLRGTGVNKVCDKRK